MKELETALTAARAGGEIIRKFYTDGVEIREKSSYNLVSDADLQAEQAIISIIKSVFPKHSFYAEEQHQDDLSSDDIWIIDPLDGTNNFAHGIPQFATSIAYYHKGIAQVGVVYNPVREECFVAVRGKGATLNDKAIKVSKAQHLSEAMIGTGFYYDRGAMMEATLAAIKSLFEKQIHGIRRYGSAALDLCYVACGYFDAFFEYTLEPWDYAAGRLIVQEAGGMITNHRGEELILKKSSLVSSNSKLHQELVEVLKQYQED